MTSRAEIPSPIHGLDGRRSFFSGRNALALAGLAPLALLALAACGGSAKFVTVREPGGLELPITIEHEPCNLSRGEAIDVNGDGRPDVVRVEANGRELCRMADLNFDGRPDAFVYFDEQGRVRRRESDFDRDGRIDEIATFAGGKVVRKDRDTNLDGKFDTWDFYENERLVRRLRDTTGAGRVNQKWTFADPTKPECAVIETDRSGDGRPDPEDLVDTCAESHAGAPAPATASVPKNETPPNENPQAPPANDQPAEEGAAQ